MECGLPPALHDRGVLRRTLFELEMTKEAEVEKEKGQASKIEVLSGKDKGEMGASGDHDPERESE